MTIEEFYGAVGGSYAAVKELFLTDERIKKYVLKFQKEGKIGRASCRERV